MGSDPWWSVYPPLLVGSLFGWLLAMLTPVCSERITLWFRGPKLQLDFTNTEDCVTLTPEEFQVTLVSFQKRVVFFARIKVTNLMPRIATQCQAWLVNVEAGDGYGDFKPTIFKDSIQGTAQIAVEISFKDGAAGPYLLRLLRRVFGSG
jgi:hypothetical protein